MTELSVSKKKKIETYWLVIEYESFTVKVTIPLKEVKVMKFQKPKGSDKEFVWN